MDNYPKIIPVTPSYLEYCNVALYGRVPVQHVKTEKG